MRSRLLPFLLLAALPACFLFRRGTESNVVFLVVDSLRYDALSQSIGSASTPNLNALARDGHTFRSCYAHSSSTLPSHVSLLSSRLPCESGVRTSGDDVAPSLPMLQAELHDRGWETFADVSSPELHPTTPGSGIDRGFTTFRVHEDEDSGSAASVNSRLVPFLQHAPTETRWFAYAQYSDPARALEFEGEKPVVTKILLDGAPIGSVRTADQGEWSVEIDVTPGAHRLELRSESSFQLRRLALTSDQTALEPTFEEGRLYAPVTRVRTTFTNDRDRVMTVRFVATVRAVQDLASFRARYKASVEAVDRAVGEVVAALKERGLYESTVIVVTGSHGEALGEHGVVGHDVTLYDELVRVPLILKPAAEEDRRAQLARLQFALVRHLDVAPTVLDMVGEGPLDGAEGISFFDDGTREWTGEAHVPTTGTGIAARRDEVYKLVYVAGEDRYEMYDVKSDTLEMDNIHAIQGHFRTQWQADLRRRASCGLRLPGSVAAVRSTPASAPKR